MLSRSRSAAFALFAVVFCQLSPAVAQSDPLPSWSEGKAKQAILDFVGKVRSGP